MDFVQFTVGLFLIYTGLLLWFGHKYKQSKEQNERSSNKFPEWHQYLRVEDFTILLDSGTQTQHPNFNIVEQRITEEILDKIVKDEKQLRNREKEIIKDNLQFRFQDDFTPAVDGRENTGEGADATTLIMFTAEDENAYEGNPGMTTRIKLTKQDGEDLSDIGTFFKNEIFPKCQGQKNGEALIVTAEKRNFIVSRYSKTPETAGDEIDAYLLVASNSVLNGLVLAKNNKDRAIHLVYPNYLNVDTAEKDKKKYYYILRVLLSLFPNKFASVYVTVPADHESMVQSLFNPRVENIPEATSSGEGG